MSHRGLDFNISQGKVPGDFVTHQEGYFVQKLPEVLAAGFFGPHDSKLVLDHGVVDYM
jgi:hypothetical protein